MKTVRQIADELGVSKQAVFKKMKREPLSTSLRGLTSTVDGRLTVSVDGENLIKSAFLSSGPSTNRQPVDGLVDGLVDAPSTEIDSQHSICAGRTISSEQTSYPSLPPAGESSLIAFCTVAASGASGSGRQSHHFRRV